MRILGEYADRSSAWSLGRIARPLVFAVLFITTVAVFVPFWPRMPAGGLDPSWALALNQAVAQQFTFGKDIVFTFGPYASIYTQIYSPATAVLMWAGSAYLALSYCFCLFVLLKDRRTGWVAAHCVFLLTIVSLRDALFLGYPLAAALCSYELCESDVFRQNRKYAWAVIFILFAPFGMLVLIKGSLILSATGTLAICAAAFFTSGRKDLAAASLLSPLVTTVVCWVASGQQLTALPDYLLAMLPIISGYTDAMATKGDIGEIVVYWLAGFAILAAIYAARLAPARRVFHLCVFVLFLFVVFKAGFVRHDIHAVIAGSGVLFAALLLACVVDSKPVLVAVALAAFCSASVLGSHVQPPIGQILNNAESTYASIGASAATAWRDDDRPRARYAAALADLRRREPLPVLPGTSDIYPYDLSFLIASGNTWSPRPVFQSYSAYTPQLAELNRQHLLGHQAPDNVFFSTKPIDGRLPSLEDGASWPELLARYSPIGVVGNYLILRHAAAASAAEHILVGGGTYALGEPVPVPAAAGLMFATIAVTPTVAGRFTSVLFKPDQLRIVFLLRNGARFSYRFVPGEARAGFLVSPLVQDTGDFASLYGGALSSKSVSAFVVQPRSGTSPLWRSQFTVSFDQIKLPVR